MKIGWAVGAIRETDSCFLARVQRPHLKLCDLGVDSLIYGPEVSADEMSDRDVIIFHRYLNTLAEASRLNATLGVDVADDLLPHRYSRLPVDFVLTDSLPNTRFYMSRATHYWPHGFPDLTNSAFPVSSDGRTRFVYCGAPENVQCLLGAPLEALEAAGRTRPITLRIITNLQANPERWLADLPKIKAEHFSLEWVQFEQQTHEPMIQQCDVGYFPQAIDQPRWQKKSIYKPTHAASLGIPSISSPTEEALMSFLDDQTALLPQTPKEWFAAVEKMCDPLERERIRTNAIHLYRTRFTIDLATQQLLAIANVAHQRRRRLRFRSVRRSLLSANVYADRMLNALERRLGPRNS